ncbi:hypothetical protein PIROE2DRAFT_64650 [Piromyces sp. E2]|nr:hypothetical protein PIROE2DRAFT_64650 [Piromyces sp. E2]|eukprot:OUM58061.1 hypothetical protein PIROE2DRAFT_64650 [Piromyces sp. E2]
MKFTKAGIILSFLSFHLKVLSVPLNSNDLNNISFKEPVEQKNTSDNSSISEYEIYDTLSDNIEIKITDAVIEDEIDSDFDEEVTIPSTDTSECTSNECIETSKRILSYMDTSINPCDDFYEFSCGGFLASQNDTMTLLFLEKNAKKYRLDINGSENIFPVPIYSKNTINNEIYDETETGIYNDYNNDNYNDDDNPLFTEVFQNDIENNYEDKLLNKMEDFNEKYPLINWKLYFEKRFEQYGLEIPVNKELFIKESRNFSYLYKFLNEIDSEDLANYIILEIIKIFENIIEIEIYNNILPEEYINTVKEFYNSYEDRDDDDDNNHKDRIDNDNDEMETDTMEETNYLQIYFIGTDENSQCLNLMTNVYKHAPNKYFVDMAFSENVKSEAKNLVENVIRAMIDRIQKIEWLDVSTREYAIEKILKIKYMIGYYDFMIDIENIYNYYYPMINTKDDYLSSLLALDSIEKKDIFESIYNENYVEDTSPFDFIEPLYLLKSFINDDNNNKNVSLDEAFQTYVSIPFINIINNDKYY